jgi:Flp pilus assembly pilin Flp
MLKKLWKDEAGLVTLEYLFAATIIVIGLTVGLVALKNSINAELSELGQAITSLNQSYSFSGQAFGSCATTGGSNAVDTNGTGPDITSVAAGTANNVDNFACP